MKYVDFSEFRRLAKNKTPRNTGVKFTSVAAPEVQGDSRTFRFCFSDSGIDLQQDKLNVNGWDTTNFEKNPVVLFQHSADSPIGKASNLTVDGDRLLGDITFAETPLAAEICELVRGGFVRAVSVGFVPIEYKFSDAPARAGGIDYEAMSLLEVSVCSIPANPRALIEAQAAGIETKTLETWLVDRVNNDDTPAHERLVFKHLLNKDMNESDPSAGGYSVTGNCGRAKDEQCGMIHPEECAIHRAEDDDDEMDSEEKTIMAMSDALKEARALIRALNKEIEAYRRKSEEADDDQSREGGDAEVYLSKAEAHRKAAEELHDAAIEHMEECHKSYKAYHKAMKAMADDGDGDEDDRPADKDEDDADDNIEKIKARAIARMSR